MFISSFRNYFLPYLKIKNRTPTNEITPEKQGQVFHSESPVFRTAQEAKIASVISSSKKDLLSLAQQLHENLYTTP
jgi:hypothetical protein